MTTSKISIIIPIYNVEKYLAKCLNSVVNQTYTNLEIICINDGSTDSSIEILEEYAKKDSRIKIVNKKNGGLSSARNAGLNVSTGEYCYFVDSDDWIELETIEKLVNIIQNNDVDVVVHSALNIAVDETCQEIADDCNNWFESYEQKNGIYDVPIEINIKIPTVTWNKLYKMDIINKYHCRFPEGLVNEDELFIWTYMIHCKNYYYLNEKLYNYLRRSDSIMGTRDNSPKILDILKIQEEIYKIVSKYKNIEEYHDYLTQNYIDEINYLYHRMPIKYRKKALKEIKKYYKKVNHSDEILRLYKSKKFKCEQFKLFLQNIFSVTNIKTDNYERKQVKIFGIKFKFKRKNKNLNNDLLEMQNRTNSIANKKIIPNKIIFNNMNGKGYGCNPKYIAEEILRQKLPYELVWLVNDVENVKDEFPKEIKLVEYNVENAIREFASAKVWISNQRMPELYENGLFKKKDQYYIQTWHGAALKQIEKDVENEKQWWCKWAKIDSQYIDLLLTAGEKEKEVFTHNFYFEGEITNNGLPRDSVFYYSENIQKHIKDKVYLKLNIPHNKKLVLYAPTFRDDERISAYNLSISKVLNAINTKFENDFVLLTRLHPNIAKQFNNIFGNDKNIINANSYQDIQELMISSEILITDYSSCMFDFMLSRKPIFLFMSDLQKYKSERNFYIDFKDLPFSIAENNDKLFDNITNFSSDIYLNKLNNFIKQYGYSEHIDIGSLINRIKTVIEEKD